jgi:hypothetical protein
MRRCKPCAFSALRTTKESKLRPLLAAICIIAVATGSAPRVKPPTASNSNSLVNLNNLSKTENSITTVKTEEPKKVFLQPKKIIQQPKEPVKDKAQIISIPLNGGTASYIPKMAEEDAEEKIVDNKPTDFISALESNKDDPRVKKFFNYHSELAKKEIFAFEFNFF